MSVLPFVYIEFHEASGMYQGDKEAHEEDEQDGSSEMKQSDTDNDD